MNTQNAKPYLNSVLTIFGITWTLFALGQPHINELESGERVFEYQNTKGEDFVFVVHNSDLNSPAGKAFSSVTKSSNVAVDKFKDGEEVSEETSILKMAMLHNPAPVDTFYRENENVFITKASKADVRELNSPVSRELKPLDMKFFPNPNDGRFNLSFLLAEKTPVEISIIDLLGNKVYQAKPINFPGYFNHNIDISDQSSGIYFLQIMQGEQGLTRKIIIQ